MALDLSGWMMKDLRQVSGAPKRDCAATRNSSFGNRTDRKGGPSPNEFANRSLAENTKAMRRWSAWGRFPARRSRPLARRPLISPKALLGLADAIAEALVRLVECCSLGRVRGESRRLERLLTPQKATNPNGLFMRFPGAFTHLKSDLR